MSQINAVPSTSALTPWWISNDCNESRVESKISILSEVMGKRRNERGERIKKKGMGKHGECEVVVDRLAIVDDIWQEGNKWSSSALFAHVSLPVAEYCPFLFALPYSILFFVLHSAAPASRIIDHLMPLWSLSAGGKSLPKVWSQCSKERKFEWRTTKGRLSSPFTEISLKGTRYYHWNKTHCERGGSGLFFKEGVAGNQVGPSAHSKTSKITGCTEPFESGGWWQKQRSYNLLHTESPWDKNVWFFFGVKNWLR